MVRADLSAPVSGGARLWRLERQRIEIVTNADLDMGDSTWVAERLLRKASSFARRDRGRGTPVWECLLSDDARGISRPGRPFWREQGKR